MSHDQIVSRLAAALDARGALLEALGREGTDCVRLLHGATEGVPGLTVDRYGPVLLVQTFREPLAEGALAALAERAARDLPDLVPVWRHRGPGHEAPPGPPFDERLRAPVGHELGLAYDVRPHHRGQDPLLFLDLRAGRRRVGALAEGASVLNLFAYTCGVGVAAVAGGAREAWNVDFAASALAVGRRNAELNRLPVDRFRTLESDALPALRQLAGLPVKGRGARRGRFPRLEARTFDLVVLDPPRWAKSAFGAVDVVRDYPSLFKPAVLATAPGGRVLATNHVPSVDLESWLDVLRRCAAKAGRPLADVEVIPPEADFPSPDGRHPLKMALCVVP